jgi:hypothetical protein
VRLRAGFTDVILMLFERGPEAAAAAERAAELLPRLRALD